MSSQLPQQSQHQPQQTQMDLTEDILVYKNESTVILGTIRWHVKGKFVGEEQYIPDYRRYRVFIERWFDRPTNERRRALVWGCNFIDLKWNREELKEGFKKIAWNGFDSYYWPDFRYKRLLEKMEKDKRPIPKFARFSVIVTSLPCMGGLEEDMKTIPPFTSNRRYGVHLYMRSNGTLLVGFFYEGLDDKVGYIMKCMTHSVAPIHDIYPVIRYEWQEIEPKSALTLGLDFQYLEKVRTDPQTGDRYYHRFGDQCLKFGNVFDLTKERIESIDKTDPQLEFIGLYVCAGAKLVVYDSYHEDKDSPKHNRTLVQQGGLVICRGPIQIDLPVEAEKKNDEYDDYYYTHLKAMGWQDFCDKYLKNVDQKPESEVRPNPGTMEQPVLFLGPINSRFGAVTWSVEVRKDSLPDPKIADPARKTVLYPPNYSRIIAIADGTDGINEIKARINYEILHDSVVTQHETDFKIPTKPVQTQPSFLSEKKVEHDVAMVRRIVNVGNERSFDVEFRTYNRESVVGNTILNYNTTTIRADPGFDERIKKFLKTQTTRWAVPPMFPPAVFLYEQGGADVYSIPSKQFKIENFDNLYNDRIGHLDIKVINLHDNTDTVFQFKKYDKAVMGYHFERLQKKEEQSFDDKSGWYQRDGPMYRLGVDGWMWKRDDGGHIYYEDIYGFFHSSQQPFQNTGQIGGRSQGPSRGSSRGPTRGPSRGSSRGPSHM